jgi:hypothetical protein
MRMIGSKETLMLPPGSDSKITYLLKFMKFWEKGLHYDVLRLSDLKPWFCETGNWFKKLFQ